MTVTLYDPDLTIPRAYVLALVVLVVHFRCVNMYVCPQIFMWIPSTSKCRFVRLFDCPKKCSKLYIHYSGQFVQAKNQLRHEFNVM